MSPRGTVACKIDFDDSVHAVAFTPDSTRLAAGGGASLIEVRAIGTGPPLDVPVKGFVSDIAFSPDGTVLAAADGDQLFAWNGTSGVVLWQGAMEPGNSVNFLAFTPDGKTLVAATDMFVATFDAATGAPGPRTKVGQTIAGFDLSRDGTLLAVAIDENHGGDHRKAGSARVLEVPTGHERSRLTPENSVQDVAFSPDGSRVLLCSNDETTRLFAADSGKQLWINADTFVHHVAYDPTGKWTVVGGADGAARVLEAESGVERSRVEHDGAVTGVAFAPNGKWAASAAIDNVVHVFDVLTAKIRYQLSDVGEVQVLKFSPDSRWLGMAADRSALAIDNGDQ